MTDELKVSVDRAASALKAVGAKEVYVFGSASKGQMRPDSDIDLAVSGLPPGGLFPRHGNRQPGFGTAG